MAFGTRALIEAQFHAGKSENEFDLVIKFQPENKKDVR